MTQETNRSFQLLLSATEQLVEEKGCRSTTLQDIMNRTGLSKGAIYHYVKSKDELLGLVLKARIEATSQRFYEAVNQGDRDLFRPLNAISEGLQHIQNEKDVTNRIFIYLLSQQENPSIRQMLHDLYEHSIRTSVKWIQTGQSHGVIPEQIDAQKAAELFTVLSYGFRMRSMIGPENVQLSFADFHSIMVQTLHNQLKGVERS